MEVSKAPQSQDSKLHFLDYWRIIRIRKAVILAVFLLVVITTAIITQFQPESYSSLARMKVEKDTPLTQLMMGSGPMTPAFDQYFLQTEFQVIRSPKILNEVIKDLKLARVYAERDKQPGELPIQDAYETLSREVDITQYRNTAIIEITAFNEDRELAARIANKIAEIYGNYRNKNRSGRSDAAWTALTNKLTVYDREVSQARDNMDKLRLELKVPEEIADSGQVQGLSAQELSRMSGVIQDYQCPQLCVASGIRPKPGLWPGPSGGAEVVPANRQIGRTVGCDGTGYSQRYALHVGSREGGHGKPEDLPSGDHREELQGYPAVPALYCGSQ